MANDTYEYATLQLLQPEVRTEPVIRPWQIILHTHGSKGTSQNIGRWFARKEVVVESHVSVARDGRLYQFQYLDRQADAQGAGNGYAVPPHDGLFGALSVESEDLGDPSRPWTQEQVASIALFIAAMHHRYWIPVSVCNGPRNPGVGWHAQFPEWNPNRHACPGKVRIAQLHDEVIPVAKYFLRLASPNGVEIVDRLDAPAGGRWELQADGGVITYDGAPFYGSYPGLPAAARQGERSFRRIRPYEGGYELVSTADESYHFPAR